MRLACVVISDITRPVPNELILRPLLKTLKESGIPRDKIMILNATGLHRPNLGECPPRAVPGQIVHRERRNCRIETPIRERQLWETCRRIR
jgi:nickel-dependent lactate racemase